MTASFNDRRPSVAERRPSNISRRSSVIPSLAGIEKPNQPIVEDQFDVLICGTGIVESVLAAALAWQGSTVLHIDANPYYGDHSATLTIDQLKAWSSATGKVGFKNFINVDLAVNDETLKSKDYGVDLNPKILFAKSDLLTLLINSRVYHYLEFQPISNFHTYENDSFGKLMSSKEEIFTSDDHSLLAKRQLMKFMKFIFQFDTQNDLIENYKDKLLSVFIKEKFKLNDLYVNELVYTLGLSSTPNILTLDGLARIKRYLDSFNIYGNFPSIHSKFGGAGELSQGFCRSAAVAGTTYKLNTHLKSFDQKSKIAVLNDNSRIKINEKIVCSPSQAPDDSVNIPPQNYKISRLITIVDKSCGEWFANGEHSAIVVFPPMSLNDNEYPIQALILGSGSGCCPQNQCIWYLHTINPDLESAQKDLNNALKKMDESILREMEFDIDINDDDVIEIDDSKTVKFKADVARKLSKSFKEFRPHSTLNHLLNLRFVQLTSTPPFGIIKPGTFVEEKVLAHENMNKKGVDQGVIYSSMPPVELSYDGVVSEAKILYRSIVGDDEDFFVVDFEDDDEDDEQNDEQNLNRYAEAAVRDESAVLDDSDDNDNNS